MHHHSLVALKVMRPVEQEDLHGFLNEARMFRLSHPNIVRILDFGVDKNSPFLVMEYAPNGSLRKRHPKGTQLSLSTIITYARQMASALQYAHNEKLIHRDVMPENMLIGSQGEVLLSDFGAALIASTSYIKITHEIIGTLSYMAPEQLQGKPCFASDQYALGITVYEWLSGQLPFHGTVYELFNRQSSTPPPSLRAFAPSLPIDVELVVTKALAKEPEQRFASVQAFATALEQAAQPTARKLYLPPIAAFQSVQLPQTQVALPQSLHVPPTQLALPQSLHVPQTQVILSPPTAVASTMATPPSDKQPAPVHGRISRRRFALATAGLIVGGGIAGWLVEQALSTKAQFQPITQTLPQKVGELLLAYRHGNEVFTVAWSSDGQYISSAGGDGLTKNSSRRGDTTIQVRDFPSGKLVNKYSGHYKVVRSVAWSPILNDHRIVSASEDGTVQVWNVDTNHVVPLLNDSTLKIYTVAWSPKGKLIAAGGDNNTVLVWDSHTTNLIASHTHGGRVYAVAWSPDEKYVASAAADSTVQVWDARTGENIFKPFEHDSPDVGAVAWSLNGNYIASGDFNPDDTVNIWNARTGTFVKPYPAIAGNLIYTLEWSLHNQYVVSGGEDHNVDVWEALTGKHIYSYTHHIAPIMAARWSPSGKYIASCGFDKTVQVWVAPPEN
jgi:serine/threonine protein kinase